ncbi:MAG TPA: HAD-IC family P-type ATPase [Candidatus Limnocylindrales bacterium]|nr:HAD-IC family P-type ATPase [Candidatus Limnocylindrales bacterium]
MSATPSDGLSDAEAERRRDRGLGNAAPPTSTRTYGEILRENVFTFVNNILFALALILALVGRPLDGLVSLFVIGTNIVVGIVQEVRAKRVLDRIAALQQPLARVVRDGATRPVRPEELVLGDLVAIEPGEQLVLDGRLVAGAVEVDESLLTGESEAVHRAPGDPVASGSFCLSGSGRYEVTAVGEASLANRITAGGRRFRRVLTPLQREIHFVIRLTLAIVIYLQIVVALDALVSRVELSQAVAQATVLAGLVPNGLFVAIAITYAAAAVRIARMGALVQQANAIESLSHVDTLCLDKTGTLTANRLELDSVDAVEGDQDAFRELIGTVLVSSTTRNRTAEAILLACPGEAVPVLTEVPFSSGRGWSAVAIDRGPGHAAGTYVLGAPSVIGPRLADGPADVVARREAVLARGRETAARGLRVLVLARHPDSGALGPAPGPGSRPDPELPRSLELLGAVSLRDVLRHDLGSTLASFARSGVGLRVISGDDPETVAALVRQAGLEIDGTVAAGPDLEGLDEPAFAAAVARTAVFGRITPPLKERIVETLRASGRYVAMIGDGVNDVLPLKRADLAVAMGSGSAATRGVADLVLLDDSFASLARAVEEGHRILNGMQPVLELFLTRIATLGVVVMSSLVVEYFPIELRNASVVTLLTVGVPSVLLALWARPRRRPWASLARTLLRFVAPATIVSSIAGLAVFYGGILVAREVDPAVSDPVATARSALTAFLVLSGIALVLFAAPPTRWFASVERPTGDRRTLYLAAGLVAAFVAILVLPAGRGVFDLEPLPVQVVGLVVLILAGWLAVLRTTWRFDLVERFVGAAPPGTGR